MEPSKRRSHQKVDNRPLVHVSRMSLQQIRDTFFAPLGQPARVEPEWCPLAEARLLQLMIKYRPIGINKHINMDLIMMYMQYIYAKEEAVNVFIRDCDLESYVAQLKLPPDQREARFEPRYVIRPTLEQIKEKMITWFDMNWLEYKESANLPDELTTTREFRFPSSYYDDIQKLDRDEKRISRKMHCPNLSTPSKPLRTPCGSKDVNSIPVSRRRGQETPHRHLSKKREPSEGRSRSTNHRVGHSREKPEQRRSSKNCARSESTDRSALRTLSRASRYTQERRRHYSEPKTLTVTPQGTAGSRRRHQSESRGRRRALKDSSSSRRRLNSRRAELEPRKQPSRKNDDTPRRPTALRERRCTVGMRVSLFSAPDAAKKQIVIPQQKRYQLRSTIALRDVPQSNSGELPDTKSASEGVPGVLPHHGAAKDSVPSKSSSDGSLQPVQEKLTSSGRVARHPPHELFPHKGTQPLPPEEAADGVFDAKNQGGDPKESPAAEVAQEPALSESERISRNKSPRTPQSSSKDKTADKNVLEFPLMKPSPEQGAMQMSLEKSAEGGGLQSSPVGVVKGNSVQKVPDEGIQEPSVSKQLADEGTAQSPPKASGSNTSALKVTGVEGMTPCSSRELRNRRRCREVQPLRHRLRAVKTESSKGKRTRDKVKNA